MLQEVEGHIAFLGLPEYLQFAGFNHRSVLLSMHAAEVGDGAIFLKDGKIVHAQVASLDGTDALFLLLAAGNASVRISDLPPEHGHTIHLSMEQVLMRLLTSLPPELCDTTYVNPEWTLRGTTRLLSLEELLQIFEANRRGVQILLTSGCANFEFFLEGGAVVAALAGETKGPDAVYQALALPDADFVLNVPAVASTSLKRYDIPSLVMEGLRRRDELHLRASEGADADNEHAREMLAALDAHELSEAERLTMAKRYLPGGEITPAAVLVRLVVDTAEAVRQAALISIIRLPEPVRHAIANDAEAPRSLLRFFLENAPDAVMLSLLIANPNVPLDALAAVAVRCPMETLTLFKEREDLLADRAIRAGLRQNPKCYFIPLLDKLDAAQPHKPKRVPFGGFEPVAPTVDVSSKTEFALAKPVEDPDLEVVDAAPTYADLLMMAMKGSMRDRIGLACHSDETIATTAVATAGLPDIAMEQIAENPTSNPAALKYIGNNPRFKRMSGVMNALLFNPRAPFSVTRDYAQRQGVDMLRRILGNRDLCGGLHELAQHLIDKKTGH